MEVWWLLRDLKGRRREVVAGKKSRIASVMDWVGGVLSRVGGEVLAFLQAVPFPRAVCRGWEAESAFSGRVIMMERMWWL